MGWSAHAYDMFPPPEFVLFSLCRLFGEAACVSNQTFPDTVHLLCVLKLMAGVGDCTEGHMTLHICPFHGRLEETTLKRKHFSSFACCASFATFPEP